MMTRLFLSHGARDADLAASIAAELRKHSIEPLDASDDAHAGDIRQTIKSAIRRADGFVLVLGAPESAAVSWASYELGMAEALGKPILLLLSHNNAVEQLPFDLVGLPLITFDPKRPDRAAQEVADRFLAPA
jgi:hypothetical protein